MPQSTLGCAIASPNFDPHPSCSGEPKKSLSVVLPLDDPMSDPYVSKTVQVPAARSRRGHERRSLGTHPFDALRFEFCAQFDALTQINYSSSTHN